MDYRRCNTMNQNKTNKVDCTRCPPSVMMPVTDQARQETELREYFIGSSGEVKISMDGNGVVLFVNPIDSGVVLNINYGEYDNFSDANVKVKVSSYGFIEGNLKESTLVTASFIGDSSKKSKAKIYVGTDVEVRNAEIDRVFLLPDFEYKQVSTNGTIMIEPGGNRIYQFVTLEDRPAEVSVTFEWWEMPMCNNNRY